MSITDYTQLKVGHIYDFTYKVSKNKSANNEIKYESAEYIQHKKLYSKDHVVFRIP